MESVATTRSAEVDDASVVEMVGNEDVARTSRDSIDAELFEEADDVELVESTDDVVSIWDRDDVDSDELMDVVASIGSGDVVEGVGNESVSVSLMNTVDPSKVSVVTEPERSPELISHSLLATFLIYLTIDLVDSLRWCYLRG